VKELNLGIDPGAKTAKHMTKTSINSAIWKVYQQLLEYTHSSDYQLLITRTTQELRDRVHTLEGELDAAINDARV
jgi:hypothetical protein